MTLTPVALALALALAVQARPSPPATDAALLPQRRLPGAVLDEGKPALIRTRAADNALWVVACNSSLRHSSWATCIARPDGSIAASLRRHVTGVLVHDFPDRRLRGWLHNLRPLQLHPRTSLHNGRPSRSPRARDDHSDP